MSNFMTSRTAPVAVALGLACLAGQAAHADGVPSAQRPVGEVTMSVGPVIRTPAQGLPETVRRGTPIRPGDRLDTADGGHLHIRFIDGAMVSIRPGSRMWVEDYQYNPQQVSMSLVRFKLEYGVARAISGAAAEGAKDRFRLNTPLVAIGVRGTDFVVRAGEATTRAAVNQGAIVMAPFGDGCNAQALGPCGTTSAKLLSADMGQLQVEFRPQLAQPEIKPLQGAVFASNTQDPGNGHVVLARNAAAPATPAGDHPESERLATTALAESAVKAVMTGQAAPPPPPAPQPVPPVVVLPDPVPVPPPVVATPEPTVPPPPPILQWGRWAAVASGDAAIAVSRAEAAEGRSVTVGNAQYSLYRATNGLTDLANGLGSYSFSLDKSYAQYEVSGAMSPASVEQGRLTLDFGNARFATDLRVASQLTGAVLISGAGAIRGDGIFFDRTVPGQAIAGAAALDGKSAGYFFEKAIGAGTLSGITLWSRP
ncbi:FecR family protein [Ramlibacter sp.]|uniref:FecR family protein n=1 Tax=Ramlibacter sp. TaxID=1917967 RepID=UPI002B810D89|nr:FecR family protein [Ramlibacter sp.]HWI84506.1 FecR family protein [Ramlibacter sp.]